MKRKRFEFRVQILQLVFHRKKGGKESKRSRGAEVFEDDQQFAQAEARAEKKRRKYPEDDVSPSRCK